MSALRVPDEVLSRQGAATDSSAPNPHKREVENRQASGSRRALLSVAKTTLIESRGPVVQGSQTLLSPRYPHSIMSGKVHSRHFGAEFKRLKTGLSAGFDRKAQDVLVIQH